MRKYIKKKLIQLLNSASGLDEMAWKSVCAGDTKTYIDALTKNQNIAMKVGQVIENTVGLGTKTVGMLENYCEQIYTISQRIDKAEMRDGLKKLNNLRSQIASSIEMDIPTRYEIVFLPYMVSMWDSLESVWKAANDDQACDVYVVALPYYEKDEHGNLTSMVYEGDKYPDDVPITDYRSYDIAGRHPDIIYFHNPYDEYNSATSIPPQYYACELRNYTDMLVYIPYFVGINGKVQRHLCALPGSMYSNRVIVESESVRQIYIEELQKFEVEKNCKGLMGNLQEKFVALGSPKFDKAVTGKEEDYQLPEEWKYLIYKEDGSRRKVILYNTTISVLLNVPNILDKIKNTINVIASCDDVVMWWRPHPLYETTIRNARPDILKDYLNIVEEYTKQGIGIFDKTTDFSRAVAMCDAYYGDGSSVAELFKNVHKPVMIQNIDVDNDKERAKSYMDVPFRTILDIDEYSIGVSETFNGIFKLNYEKSSIEYLCRISGEKLFGGTLYCKAIMNGKEIIFIPFCAEEIAVLKLYSMEISKHSLPATEMYYGWKFSSVCRYKNKLFLIPGKYEYIVSFDMDSYEVRKLVLWKELLPSDIIGNDDKLLSAAVIGTKDERAYIQVIYTNILLVLNMEAEEIENVIYLPKGNYAIATAYEDDVWVIPSEKGSILKISTIDLSVEEFCDSPLSIENDSSYTSVRVIFSKDKMYMFPQGSTRIGIVDINTGMSSTDSLVMDKLYEEKGEFPRFMCVKELGQNRVHATVYYKDKNLYQNIIISLDDMDVERVHFIGNDAWKKEYLVDYVEGNDEAMYSEKAFEKLSIDNPLALYLDYIKSMDKAKQLQEDKTVGEKIHEFIRS